MADLVPLPYQPEVWTTPALLARLADASRRAGHNILINGSDGGWRALATQVAFWVAYQAFLAGGPWAAIASNPYTGQRNHMRGAAVDILNRADIPYMLAAGFLQDPDEWWHFNLPEWASMPIIPTNTSVAGGDATPIQEEEMSAQAEAEIHAIWAWMGGGQTFTEFAKIEAAVASVKSDTKDIPSNLARVVKATDLIQWWLNGNATDNPNTSIRKNVLDMRAELDAWLAKHP